MKRRLTASARMLRAAVAIVCAVATPTIAFNLYASEWNTDSSGLFGDPLNWNGPVPGVNDDAIFDRGDVSFTVSFNADATARATYITTSEVTLQSLDGPRDFFAGDLSIAAWSASSATLKTQLASLNATELRIGSGVNSNGRLDVLAGSLNIVGEDYQEFAIGVSGGTGTLNIQNGAVVNNHLPAILGAGDNSHGFVNVEGPGSTWNNAEYFHIGNDGEGALSITTGGSVSSRSGSIYSHGSATIDGAGSQWMNTEYFYVGSGATLALTNQAKLDVGWQLENHGSFTGDGTVIAENFFNFGTVHLKPSSSGLVLQGNYSDSGELDVQLASSSLYGKLTTTGTTSFHGSLQLSLTNNYSPQPGDSFDILGSAIQGGFSSLVLPALNGGLRWDLSQLNSSGIVSVNATAPDTWKAAVDGDWSDDSRWLDGSAPGVSDSVLLAVGSLQAPYNIAFSSAPAAIKDLALTAGEVTLMSVGGVKTLNVTAPGGNHHVTISGAETVLQLGNDLGTPVYLNVGNELVVNAGAALGTGFLSESEISVGGNVLIDGGTLAIPGDRFHLSNGSSITVENGGDVWCDGFATPLNSVVTVTGPNSRWNGSISIVDGGQMSVANGGTLNFSGQLDVGTQGNGVLLIDGESSSASGSVGRWGRDSNSANVTFSHRAQGNFDFVSVADQLSGNVANVNITSGASLTINSIIVAPIAGGNSSANFEVQGADSLLRIANATFGSNSTGLVTVNVGTSSDGARLVSLDGAAVAILKTATINIGGASSQGDFTAGGNVLIDGGLLNVAAGSTFELAPDKQFAIQNGGRAEIAGDYATGARGVYNLIGPLSELQIHGTLAIQYDSQVNLSDGNSLEAPGGLVVASGGQVNLPAGTSLDASGSSTTLRPQGMIQMTGGSAHLGTLNADGGAIQLTSGAVTFFGNLNTGADQPFGPSPTIATNQYVTLDGTTTIHPLNTLTLAGGSLTTGQLVNDGTFAFTGGTLRITGAQGLTIGSTGPLGSAWTLGAGRILNPVVKTEVQSAAYFAIDGGASFTTGAFNNSGETNLTGPAATLHASAVNNFGLLRGEGRIVAAMNNLAGGEIRAEADKTLTFIGGAVNTGRINLQAGTIDFFQPLVNAAGIISGHGAIFAGGTGIANAGQMNFSGGTSEVFGGVHNQATLLGGIRVLSGSNVTFWNDVTSDADALFNVSGGSSATFLGNYSGSGISGPGNIEFHGKVSPGISAAAMNMGGNVALGTSSVLDLQLGGTAPGSQYDVLSVSGSLHLDGLLRVSLADGFTPFVNDSFTLLLADSIDGSFSAIELPDLPGPLAWKSMFGDHEGTIQVIGPPAILGDFDGDYDVDGADFVVWQANFPAASGHTRSTGDADGDGDVDGADFTWWQTNFPTTPAASVIATVPEPCGIVLGLVSAFGCWQCRRRRG
ncbi:MAG: hypothetical protein IT427_10665 [Pirellulales bacterium]|nr:hypothetical protein [Pirellulales bacterium]